jgi:hypothetical protein
MNPGSVFDQKVYLGISLGALALLIVSFIALDNYILVVVVGEYGQWIAAIFFLLITYYVYSLARAIIFRKKSSNKIYYTMAIVVCLLALFTFAIDKIMIEEIAKLYQEGLGFFGEQRMLLISSLIKFLALIVSALAAVKAE